MNKNILKTATLAAALSLTLVGCGTTNAGDSSAAGSQSVREACDSVTKEIEPMGSRMTEAMSELATNPELALSVLLELETGLVDAANGVKNEEVKTQVNALASGLGTIRELTEQAGDDLTSIDVDAFTTASTEIAAVSTEISALCS
ncbi:hypothetical protein [Lysinibacter sp. HNR]|uniref:hypothetical protein n=1 Tax=Lysinibacter sp. HNR TaxID=3031408 RepID=UPI0024356AF5|nr:hypothetical protein [Lysinibacter sp. HNR]WGD36843.1 hypothetical protein FrondiHNR_10335 [Lysinibacter sp. HNR]